MKFAKKFLITLCTFLALFAFINKGTCSENIQPANNAAVVEQKFSGVSQGQQASQTTYEQESQPLEEIPQEQQPKSDYNPVMSMFMILLKVVILILIFGIIGFLYKRFKQGQFGVKTSASKPQKEKKPKTKGKKEEVQANGPSDVSEAVSSFVKHRIKR